MASSHQIQHWNQRYMFEQQQQQQQQNQQYRNQKHEQSNAQHNQRYMMVADTSESELASSILTVQRNAAGEDNSSQVGYSNQQPLHHHQFTSVRDLDTVDGGDTDEFQHDGEAQSPNFREYHSMLHNNGGEQDSSQKVNSRYQYQGGDFSPDQLQYPTTQMTTEDNEQAYSYFYDEDRLRQTYSAVQSESTARQLQGSPSEQSRQQFQDNMSESQESILMQQQQVESHRVESLMGAQNDQPRPRLIQRTVQKPQQQVPPPRGNNQVKHKRSQERLQQPQVEGTAEQPARDRVKVQSMGSSSERHNSARNAAKKPEHFVDETLAKTVNERPQIGESGFQTEAAGQREVRPLQAQDYFENQQRQVDSKRKLMEELLTLKQEVTKLRRAAELNETSDAKQPVQRNILQNFKEQIQALRANQDELQRKYDAQERHSEELQAKNEHLQDQLQQKETFMAKLQAELVRKDKLLEQQAQMILSLKQGTRIDTLQVDPDSNAKGFSVATGSPSELQFTETQAKEQNEIEQSDRDQVCDTRLDEMRIEQNYMQSSMKLGSGPSSSQKVLPTDKLPSGVQTQVQRSHREQTSRSLAGTEQQESDRPSQTFQMMPDGTSQPVEMMVEEAEQTLGLPPRPTLSKYPNAPTILSTRSRPPIAATPNTTNLFDQNRMKRDEISQFLEQNGAGNLSTISGGGLGSNNVSSLQLRNMNQSSNQSVFNRTDMRIYQELFPGRELKAQKFFDLNTTAPMMRSPSFNNKGGQAVCDTSSMLSGQRKPFSRPSSQGRSSSQLRLNKPRNMAQQVEAALTEILASLEEQNVQVEVCKVPDKALLYEIRLPDKSKDSQAYYQDTFSQNQPLPPSQTHERRQLQKQVLGRSNSLLATEKQRLKVKQQNQYKRVSLAVSGDRLMVRAGGGFTDFFEFLSKKGFLSLAQ